MLYETPLLMNSITKNRLLNLGIYPRTVLDIGAYEGYWSKDIKSLFPNCEPFMIEADTDKEELLQKTGFRYDISLLAEKEKDVVYYKSKMVYTTGNTIYQENSIYFTDPSKYYTEVRKSKTLKEIVKKNEITNIDMIKLDVQGAEKDVMLGGLDIIREAKVLFIELSVIEYNKGSPSFAEMISFLDSIGFMLVDIVDLSYSYTEKKLEQFNAIFLNKFL